MTLYFFCEKLIVTMDIYATDKSCEALGKLNPKILSRMKPRLLLCLITLVILNQFNIHHHEDEELYHV